MVLVGGIIVDRIGTRSPTLLFAAFPLPACTEAALWLSTVFIGIASPLEPEVLWPAVSYFVAPNSLGTAYGQVTMSQNVERMIFDLAAGGLDDAANAGADNPGGSAPMLWMFMTLSFFGFLFVALLRQRATGPHGHGLESIHPIEVR